MSDLLTVETAWQALKSVIDPEIYQNIVDLGLVYDIAVSPANEVAVTMTLTTPHCPMGPQIIENVETVLRNQGAAGVAVTIVWQPAWTPYAMTPDLQRQLGILPPDEPEPEEPEEVFLPPPPVPKKKGFLAQLFGR
jgi:metal-sulfur cluster biosynthetic enzyme